jgi:acid phosphatase type 7
MSLVVALLAAAALLVVPSPAAAADAVVAAAGDIACDRAAGTTTCKQMMTSDLLVDANLAGVLTLGDNQYECGGLTSFALWYEPSWGRVKAITHPALGNHEYQTSGGTDCDTSGSAGGYFDYFNGVGNANGPAGERGKGYYSYDLGSWHLIALNSNCSKVSCASGQPQEQWLRADLAANPGKCTLAYMHHSRFSSGATHGDTPSLTAFWQALYDYHADIVLSGHDHVYERFAPQTATGVADPANGIRGFVVGTGGKALHQFGTPKPNSEARDASSFGVLILTLHPYAYDWQFTPVAGGAFTDTGSQNCHATLAGPGPDGYARPKAATPTVLRLVPAFDSCEPGQANSAHGVPLSAAACDPAVPISGRLTVGTPDANGRGASSSGSVKLQAVGESPIDPGNGDQADVRVTVGMSDVLERGDLSDYDGELELVATLRITDRLNGAALDDPATVTEVPLRFTVPCATTGGPEGASCQLTTTAEGTLPSVATEGKRSIWELVDVKLYDGGPDGIAQTGNNTLFAVPGLLAP